MKFVQNTSSSQSVTVKVKAIMQLQTQWKLSKKNGEKRGGVFAEQDEKILVHCSKLYSYTKAIKDGPMQIKPCFSTLLFDNCFYTTANLVRPYNGVDLRGYCPNFLRIRGQKQAFSCFMTITCE